MADSATVKAINAAIREGNRVEFERLVSEGQDRWAAGEQFGSWLHVAAEYGQLEIVKSLVEAGLDIDKTNEEEERSPLYQAVYSGNIDVVAYLLAKGARMDVSTPEYNPLFAAIRQAKPEIAKLLIDAGIDTTKQYRGTSGKVKDALTAANDWGQRDIAKMIEASRMGGSQGHLTAASEPSHKASDAADSVGTDLLTIATREGIVAFRRAVEQFPQDQFYALCFYTDNDLSSVYPHANTIKSLMQVDSSDDPNYFKWAPAEWKLDFGQYGDADLMPETNAWLRRQADSDVEFATRKRQAIVTLSQALLNIKKSSVFDGHADLKRLAVWVNIGDATSGEIEWMFEPVVDHMPPDIVEELRALFEFKVGQGGPRKSY